MEVDQIITFLSNNASAEERAAMEQWLAESVENKALFEKVKILWAQSLSEDKPSPDVDAAWQKVKKDTVDKQVRLLPYFMRIAAAITVLVISYSFWSYLQKPEWIIINHSSLAPIALEDGTKVWLNKGATLSFPKHWGNKERLVKLSGEAFFEVTEHPKKPFRIETANTGIQVLGTSFGVMAHPDSNNTWVQVQSGTVAFYTNQEKDKALILTKNQKAVYDKINNNLAMKPASINDLAWKTRVLEFSNTPLKEVAIQTEKLYGVQLIFDPVAIENCTLTAVFKKEPVENIIKTIAVLFKLKTKQQNNTVTLSGVACTPD